ncbi:hypothetical protein LF41_2463 [Lysobacter dokdonensis DS-58]|uniref:Uncharacterized protein n=1 Tax=Lysobacter dokdonensis DS-58 TaxID=1300345 RepID=A0A0A2WID9_9GAMM|nr:hypothetical protein [Lysobacter dokdonensis]KGQ19956.1 hypothetical protein LF41_2463 [Lysobacter dokdonensis DS-58]
MSHEPGSPDAFAQAMLERSNDPTIAAKPPKGMPMEMLAAALVAVVLAGLAYALAN